MYIQYKDVFLGIYMIQWWPTWPSISPSNIAVNANPGTVLKSACPEDSKTPSTCLNWLSFDWDIWDQRQMLWF